MLPLEITVKLGAQIHSVGNEADKSTAPAKRDGPQAETLGETDQATRPVAQRGELVVAAGTINRGLLGPRGVDLSEGDYVQTVAGLGASAPRVTPTIGPPQSLRWSCSRFLAEREVPRTEIQLRDVARTWAQQLSYTNRQVLVESATVASHAPDLFDVAHILSHPAAGLTSVAIDLETPRANDQWQWPLRVAAFADDFAEFRLKEFAGRWPSSSLTEPQELSRERARAEVLIIGADLRSALQRILALPYRVRAGYCIFFKAPDSKWNEVRSHFDTLLIETQSGGASFIELRPDQSAADAMNDWIERLSHNVPFDQALANVFPAESSVHVLNAALIQRASLPATAGRLAPRLRQLPAGTPFTVPPEALNIGFSWTTASSPADLGVELEKRIDQIPYLQESQGATAISRISAAERDARRAAAASEPPRYLQGNVSRLVEGKSIGGITNLVAGQNYRFEVFVGESGLASLQVDAAFPAELLDWKNRDSCTLQVIFAEPQQWPEAVRGTLRLPRRGRSTTCTFAFTPTKPGAFAGRIVLLHRGRVLQTAVLAGQVFATLSDYEGAVGTEKMRFQQEAIVRQSLGALDDRRPFDAAIVLNHTSTGKSAMTAAGERGAYIASLEGIDPQVRVINGLLNQVALNVKAHTGV